LYTFHAFHPTYSVDCPEGETFLGGKFIDDLHVLIYSDNGNGYIYELSDFTPKKEMIQNVQHAYETRENSLDIPKKKKISIPHLGPKTVSQPKENDESPSGGNVFFNQFLGVLGIKTPVKSPSSTPKEEPLEKHFSFVKTSSEEKEEDLKQNPLENIFIPENQKKEPLLLQTIQSKIKNENFFQWTTDGKFLIRTTFSGKISVWLINFDDKFKNKVEIESVSSNFIWKLT
jgi:hypothetical protein